MKIKEDMVLINSFPFMKMVRIGHEVQNIWINPNLKLGYHLTSSGFSPIQNTDRDDLISKFVKNKNKEELKKVLKMIGYEN